VAQPCGKMQSIELGFYLDRGACCVHVFLEGKGLLRISQKRRSGDGAPAIELSKAAGSARRTAASAGGRALRGQSYGLDTGGAGALLIDPPSFIEGVLGK
jgi:hypothetical protein